MRIPRPDEYGIIVDNTSMVDSDIIDLIIRMSLFIYNEGRPESIEKKDLRKSLGMLYYHGTNKMEWIDRQKGKSLRIMKDLSENKTPLFLRLLSYSRAVMRAEMEIKQRKYSIPPSKYSIPNQTLY